MSDEAYKSIRDFVQEAKMKSRKAWKRAGREVRDLTNREPNEISNNIVDSFEQIDILPGDEVPTEELLTKRLTELKKDMDSNEKEILRRQVSELMGLEERNNSLEVENQRLLKLLTDKKQTLPEITISQ